MTARRSATLAFDAGYRLGSYEILAPLGAGGMGEVYRARDTTLGRDVAIKILPQLLTADPDRRARFDREARLLAALNHPHIAQIYGLEGRDGQDRQDGRDGRDPFTLIVMELVAGGTLADARPRPRSIPETLAVARQIAEALEYAHERGIIHRDLKPANIMLTPDGVVKILDFGLAKAVTGDGAGIDLSAAPTITSTGTRVGVVLGTPAYMSPEQARGQPVDKRTDIWAFGCVLFEMLCGRAAFPGDTANEVVAKILEREPDWAALPAATPAAVRHLLPQCLEKDPKQRMRDIGDARMALDEALHPAHPVGAVGPRVRRRGWLALAATVVAITVAGALWFRRAQSAAPQSTSYVPITNFADSATQPALSPDGRMIAFIRGAGALTFFTPGEIYVKLLPDGTPVQLTNDNLRKMSPVFSPDGSRIAYTTVLAGQKWDTWIVPVLGGAPRLWLPNASGLIWSGPHQLLFSEIKTGQHMGIVAAAESRADARDLYLPSHTRAMAHKSYASPDGRSVLLVEMDGTGAFTPCRVVPADGSSTGRQVGPPGAPCTSAAWSPDGAWIYLSAYTPGNYLAHVWRERFSGGRPEAVTSGPTGEEGIAMAPDGRSFITSAGQRQRTISIHDARGERQVSAEGYAYQPSFSPDSRTLYYRILKGGGQTPYLEKSELWAADLESGRSEPLLPGFAITGYDISDDGRRVVFAASDDSGRPRLWLADVDRRAPPRVVPNAEGLMYPHVGRPGEIIFVAADGDNNFAFRIREDGTGREKFTSEPVDSIQGVSPDRRWIVLYSPVAHGDKVGMGGFAYRLDGGAPVLVDNNNWRVSWSANMKNFYVMVYSTGMDSGGSGRTFVLPVKPGGALPDIPPGGFRSEADLAAVPGVRVIDHADVTPGSTDSAYAFSAGTVQRNLYRIPIR